MGCPRVLLDISGRRMARTGQVPACLSGRRAHNSYDKIHIHMRSIPRRSGVVKYLGRGNLRVSRRLPVPGEDLLLWHLTPGRTWKQLQSGEATPEIQHLVPLILLLALRFSPRGLIPERTGAGR